MRADLLLRGGAVHPLGRFGTRAVSHLVIAGERVLAAGGRELEGLRGPRTRVVDLGGRCVLPGFDDAHAHVVYFGLTSFGADLTGSRSLAEIQARIRRVHERLAPGRWLVARGYSAAELSGRPPVREELDAVVGDRPMYADERGGHSRVASTAALALAGLDGATVDPVGGSLGRRPDGSLDGRLIESAMRLVSDHQPAPDFQERLTGILRCQRLLLSRGITAVGAAVNRGFADDLAAFQELADGGRLKLRVNEFLSWELLPALSRLGLRRGFGGGRLRAGPVKVFVDGGAAAGAVALRDSADPLWRTSPEDLTKLVAAATAAGLQVAAHAVGDGAIAAFCDAVEAAGPAAMKLRHRVEHCTACPPDLQVRLARLRMAAVMQPLFASVGRSRSEGVFPEALRPHLAAHRALLRAGVTLAFSSDLPVVPDPNPWAGIAAAVTDPAGGLTLLQALRAYTAGGAYVAFAERDRGTLEPGKLADFQVLEADPFRMPPKKWPGLRPSAVAVGGAPAWGTL